MALVERGLFGVIDKVEISIARLREMEPKNGYYLAFSGGKDSCVIKQLAIEAGVKFDAHYSYVGIDPPELVEFIKRNHADCEFQRPAPRFFSLLRSKKFPPTRKFRWCCESLKETCGSGRTVLLGIRWSESASRSKRRFVELCPQDNSKRYICPILEWTDEDVWEFIRDRKLPYCSLYDEGYTRIGCLLCPVGKKSSRLTDAARYPKLVRAWELNLDRLIPVRSTGKHPVHFTSGHEWFQFWLNEETRADPEQQCFKFDSEEE